MKIEVEDIKKVVQLNNSIIGNRNLKIDGPLSHLIFVIRDGKLYTVAQGSKVSTTMAMLIEVGGTDQPEGVYAISGDKFNKTLSEVKGEVELTFINTDERCVVELGTNFGVITFTVYRVEVTNDTNFDAIIPAIEAKRDEANDEGYMVDKEDWEQTLKIVGASTGEEFVSDPFTLSKTMAGIKLVSLILRYHANLPYTFSTSMDVIRVMQQIVGQSDKYTKSQVVEEGVARPEFVYTSKNITFIVKGIKTQKSNIEDFKWEQDPTFTGEVNTDELKQLIRLSNIFSDERSSVVMNWDFEDNELTVTNEGVELVNQSGVNTKTEFKVLEVSDKDITTTLDGPVFLNLLGYTDDETVKVEIIDESESNQFLLHVTFSEGDFYVYFRKH